MSEDQHDTTEDHEQVDEGVADRAKWARRRQENVPTGENLLVVACMDERIPVGGADDELLRH